MYSCGVRIPSHRDISRLSETKSTAWRPEYTKIGLKAYENYDPVFLCAIVQIATAFFFSLDELNILAVIVEFVKNILCSTLSA